ncbi:MAG: dihydrodipicolinate synthase family protein [Sphaerochaeta associata]|uniref:dihydrodipicolinate synthase family protein n=1 Tax=Sphaerochaeta associata TaxID=1129264 RepID=UPI002B220FF1|nr:dihydrodipicolinate synthase family protein [Sphaerochaeta associata]MEA5107925.1 dihydrodipicolinate synthase family protein [Sphaerochaeta associata]
MNRYTGIHPAFYACYDASGAISPSRIREFASHLHRKGVSGLYVGGSSGECIYQSVSERKLVLESVLEAVQGKLTVIAHVACNNTSDSVELARHAQACKVDAIASIPPIYFHLPEHAISAYWNEISNAAPDTDFFIYNIPQLAGTALTKSLLLTMLKNPNVVGVKNSSMPTQDIQLFKMLGGEHFTVFNGPDEQFIAGRMIGADGGIGGTYGVMPSLFLRADEAFKAGDVESAQAIQYAINRIIYKMCEAKGNLYAVMKEVLRKREDIDLGSVRKPLPGLYEEDALIVAEAVQLLDTAHTQFC